jgi:hypothetical protein
MVIQPLIAQQSADQFGLRIVIAEGDAVSIPVGQISPRPPVVIVEDRGNRPIANAIVEFTTPATGPSGVFENGARSITVRTDANGRAVGLGFRSNATPGAYQIQVRAQFLNETATGAVGYTNIAASRGSGRLIAILAAVGAGAVGAVVAGSRGGGGGGGGGNGGGGNPPGPNPGDTGTPPTITFGGASVGAPTP